MDIKELRKKLGIDDYLELVKEDRNCHGAYVSFGQYMYLLEKENQELKKQLEEKENQQKEFIECLENKLLIIDNILNTEIYESKIHYALIRKTAFEEILSKYNEIIGGKDE